MPSLKRVLAATPPSRKSPPAGGICRNDDDDDDDDGRFSQAPDNGGAIRNIIVAAADAASPPLLSIARAIGKSGRGKRAPPPPVVMIDNDDAAADVVAVILSATYATGGGGYDVGDDDVVRFLVGDRTLPRGRCARVVVAGRPSFASSSSSSSSSAQSYWPLRPGDVVRWNRLEVRRVHDDDDGDDYGRDGTTTTTSTPGPGGRGGTTDDGGARFGDDASDGDDDDDDDDGRRRRRDHRPSLIVACDLSTSWRDPEAGPSMARLCRIVPTMSSDDDARDRTSRPPPPTTTRGDWGGLRDRRDHDCFDLEWEVIVPPSMETPRDVVVGLARWYCANARPHFAKSTATPPANRPCRRRRLRDITAPNLLSHVVVKVLRCERANSASREVVTHVALSDGSESDDLLGMVGASTRGGRRGVVPGSVPSIPWSISSVLLRSMEDGSRVLLTHALSRSSTGGLGGAPSHDRGSLILVPTAETTASILAPDHPYYVHSNITGGVGEDPFALQLVSVMSQQHGHCRGVMAVEAPLMDIIVDGIPTSFMEGSHWQTPCLLSRFLIDHPSISTGFQALDLPSSYRSATLILDPISLACDIMINADGDAMKLICMDVPVEDMVFDAKIVTPNPYLSHVGELLKALCTEKVPIRWILEQESEYGWFVTNATLLNISN